MAVKMCQQRGISILSILLGTCMALSVASAESSKPEYTKPSTEYEGRPYVPTPSIVAGASQSVIPRANEHQ